MQLANAFCRYLELAQPIKRIERLGVPGAHAG
jgi:hypothetical protein